MDQAPLVDDDHRIRNGVEDRLEMCFPRPRIPCARRGAQPAPLQKLTAPSHARANRRKGGRMDDFGGRQMRKVGAREDHRQEAQRRRQQPRPKAAGAGGNQNGRQEQQIGRLPACRPEQELRRKCQPDRRDCDCVAQRRLPRHEPARESAILARPRSQVRKKGPHAISDLRNIPYGQYLNFRPCARSLPVALSKMEDMAMPAPIAARSRALDKPTTPPPAADHDLSGVLELMGAPIH
jgi:hypothetical protein